MAFQNTAFQATAFLLAGLSAAEPTMVWQQPLSRPPAKRVLYYQSSVDVVAIPAVDTTARSVSIGGPSVQFRRTLQYQSFAYCPQPPPVAAVDVTIDKWQQPLSKVPPRTPPAIQSQAIYAFPPQPGRFALFDIQTSYLSVRVLHYQDKFETVAVTADNNVTGQGYYRPWPQAAKQTWPPLAAADVRQFAVPEPQFGVQWLMPFGRALVSAPRQNQQPLFAYAPTAASNLTTTLEWLRPWQGPPNYSPPWIAPEPFVPKEAVLENTVTPDKWLFRFEKAVPRPPVWATQPFFGYPYISAPTLTTTLEWLRPWQGPPRYQPVKTYYQPWVPRAPIVNLTTTLEWLQAWKGPPRYRPVKSQWTPFVPQAAIVDVQTPDKWLRPLAGAAPRRPVWVTQPRLLPAPPAVEAEDFIVFSTTTTLVSTRALHYESTFVPYYPYVSEPADAGPADEHERVACVPLALRVATVPALSRVVDVPLSDRDQDSNEYRDRTCGTPPAPVVTEPEVPTDEDGAFQDDTFQDDTFQV